MTKRILYIVVSLAMINFLLVPAFALTSNQLGLDDAGRSNLKTQATPADIVGGLINVVLTLVGLISVIIIIVAGFKYLTSGGNDEKVGEARKLLLSGIIGLVLILAAYAITRFVLENLAPTISGSTGGQRELTR